MRAFFLYVIFRTASLSCAAFFRGRRLRTECLRAWGRAIPSERPSERERQEHFAWQRAMCSRHRPHRQVEVRRDRADVRTGRRKRGRMRPWKRNPEGGKPSGVRRCAAFAEKLPVFLLFTGTFVPKLALFSSCCAFSHDKSRGSTDERGRKRTRKRENVHSRRQKLVVSPFSCKFAAEIPAPHSHFPLACGGLQSTP